MHIPDGFLDFKTWGTLAGASTGMVSWASYQVKRKLDEKKLPLLGLTAAFIFAAQMVNFPIAGGTSGHFMGATLAAILLGPFAATLVMTIVLIVQCLVFQDGGLLALGANIFNMGIIGVWSGYVLYRIINHFTINKQNGVGIFIGGWFSVVLAASACALELSIAGCSQIGLILPAMAGVHALIGIGEGLITTSAVALISRVRPDILESASKGGLYHET